MGKQDRPRLIADRSERVSNATASVPVDGPKRERGSVCLR